MKKFRIRSNCRLCESTDLSLVFKLKDTPPANAFVSDKNIKQELFPLEIYFCNNCFHVQLLTIIEPKELFENYVYVSGTSPVFVDHFKRYAEWILEQYPVKDNSLVVDIGSNDGTLLRFFKNSNKEILGIDPAKEIVKKANESGIRTLTEFFNKEVAEKIVKKFGCASIICANNVFAHDDDLDGFVKAVKILLDKNGIFVFEVSYLLDVIQKTLFDTIYHEHLSYHTIIPLVAFFKRNNMEIIDVKRIETHGGSIRCVVQHINGPHKRKETVNEIITIEKEKHMNESKTFVLFKKQVDKHRKELSALLQSLKKEGKKIAGFGAPAKATTLMYEFEIDEKIIDFVVDDSPLKQGLFTPGMHIPVVPSSEIYEKKPDYMLILAWNFAESIMAKHKKFNEINGKFIVPLPKLEVH